MNPYWARSTMILLVFMNLAINVIAMISNYRLGYVMWAAYFLILLGLVITHKKDAVRKAMLNVMFLTLIALPISGLSIPVSIIVRHLNLDAVKGNFYIFMSILAILYLAIRHEKFSILDTVTKLSVYIGEVHTMRLKASFARYIISETIVFGVLTFVAVRLLG